MTDDKLKADSTLGVDPERDENREGEMSVASLRIQDAQRGDLEALSPVIQAMSPCLLALARRRIGTTLRMEAEDVVQEAWWIAFKRLDSLKAVNGRLSAVLFRFLATTIIRMINDHLRDVIRESLRRSRGTGGAGSPVWAHRQEASSVVGPAMRSEACREMISYLDAEDDADRDLFLLRGCEGLSYELIGKMLNVAPNTLAKRYQRLREKIVAQFDSEVLGEVLN